MFDKKQTEITIKDGLYYNSNNIICIEDLLLKILKLTKEIILIQ